MTRPTELETQATTTPTIQATPTTLHERTTEISSTNEVLLPTKAPTMITDSNTSTESTQGKKEFGKYHYKIT